NQEHVIMAAESDRRFQVFEIDPKHARDIEYFKALQAQLDKGGYAAMLHDLLNMDLGDWHPRNMVPDGKRAEQVASAKPQIQWLAGYLDAGYLAEQTVGSHGHTVNAGMFYEYARKNVRGLADWSDYRLAKFLDEWGVEQKRSNGSKRVFPPLLEMRQRFRERY